VNFLPVFRGREEMMDNDMIYIDFFAADITAHHINLNFNR
jgi:hypothetical protein